jgi:hypothetical protein
VKKKLKSNPSYRALKNLFSSIKINTFSKTIYYNIQFEFHLNKDLIGVVHPDHVHLLKGVDAEVVDGKDFLQFFIQKVVRQRIWKKLKIR